MKTVSELKNELREARKRAFLSANSRQDVIEAWKEDKRTGIPKEAKKLFCGGCRQDYYNGGGASECWSLSKSKLCARKIYHSLQSTKPDEVITLNCYTQEYH